MTTRAVTSTGIVAAYLVIAAGITTVWLIRRSTR